eukprot:765331-Hanusia_phi.AAC.1
MEAGKPQLAESEPPTKPVPAARAGGRRWHPRPGRTVTGGVPGPLPLRAARRAPRTAAAPCRTVTSLGGPSLRTVRRGRAPGEAPSDRLVGTVAGGSPATEPRRVRSYWTVRSAVLDESNERRTELGKTQTAADRVTDRILNRCA